MTKFLIKAVGSDQIHLRKQRMTVDTMRTGDED